MIYTKFTCPKLRAIAFHSHRWLGLVTGILLCIAGITGSILVFWHEIDRAIIAARFGPINPTESMVSIDAIAATVKSAYASKGLTLNSLDFPSSTDQPYILSLQDAAKHYWHIFVNPYTGQILGDRQWETSWIGRIYELHYTLLAGDVGVLIMGIVSLVTLLLSLTGIVLWPGWRKLASGFKIKWNAHIKRRNFDLHKVAGIVTAVFLAAIGFTGFAWNIPQANVEAAIYVMTFTPKPADPVSQPIAGQSPLPLADLLQRADAAVPNAKTTYIAFANQPEDPVWVGKKQAGEVDRYGSTSVALDRFSGKIVRLQDGLKPTRAEAIINQFAPLHFGTFGGLLTRILYVVVGIAPLILLVTGLMMWLYRKKTQKMA